MSVIGPRPGLWNQDLLTAERDKYGANDVRPGVTGWAQINGRDELESSVNYYIDNLGTYRDYYVTSFVHIGSFIRACGFFNEPGFYGTIIALFLVIDGINLKKLDNVIILIAGVLTFSAAFYILLIGYAILKLVISKPVLGVFALFIFIFVIYFLNNLYYSYSDNSIFWRIIGIITGKQNNRSYDTINDNIDYLDGIKIGNNVHVGTNAIIMPGVCIGDNCVI